MFVGYSLIMNKLAGGVNVYKMKVPVKWSLIIAAYLLLIAISTLFNKIYIYQPAFAQQSENSLKSENIKDIDKDGISDLKDNCPTIENPKQIDINSDGFGDKCVPTTTIISTNVTIGFGFVSGENSRLGLKTSLGKEVRIGSNVFIGTHVRIHNNVTIGNGTTIEKGVVIRSNVLIDENCRIGINAIIGKNVQIGKRVAIGKNATIIDKAIVFDDTKVEQASTFF